MTTAAAAAATTTTTVPSGESSRPSWLLLNAYARVGICPNQTTAHGKGRNYVPISVSLVTERPPLPSNLYVHCPSARFREIPCLLSMVGDLILIHAYTGPSVCAPSRLQSDFFIYRADPKRPSLDMLTHPKGQVSRGNKFCIIPRGEDHYTVAALVPSEFKENIFLLHLYDSETKIWSRKELFVESPRKDHIPDDLPISYRHILQHNSNTVVTLGENKTGWVDLWTGIVFCDDMLSHNRSLSWVPLPLPLKCTRPYADDPADNPLGEERFHRGIAFTDGCLRLAELEFDVVVQVPYVYDKETGCISCETKNWTITTWTNKEMNTSNAYDGWHKDCTLQASDILLGDLHSESSELPPLALQNLFVSDPIFGMNENDDGHVVYLTARTKFMHPESWLLAVDTRERKVRSLVKLPREKWFRSVNYCSCSISK